MRRASDALGATVRPLTVPSALRTEVRGTPRPSAAALPAGRLGDREARRAAPGAIR